MKDRVRLYFCIEMIHLYMGEEKNTHSTNLCIFLSMDATRSCYACYYINGNMSRQHKYVSFTLNVVSQKMLNKMQFNFMKIFWTPCQLQQQKHFNLIVRHPYIFRFILFMLFFSTYGRFSEWQQSMKFMYVKQLLFFLWDVTWKHWL